MSRLASRRGDLKQIRRFVVVGGSNTVFTYLFYQLLNLFMGYRLAFTLSFAAGVLFSAFFNARYSFTVGLSPRALLRYAVFYLISYGLGLQILIFCVEVLHIHEALAPLIVVGVMLPFTFLGSRTALTGQLTRR